MMDQAELLALVAKGKEAWNEWAEANPDAKVDFSGAKFDKYVSFEDFRFRYVYFRETKFLGGTNFMSATFSGDADFRNATFSGDANFRNTTFSSGADFRTATFSGVADFRNATFSGDADFSAATFSGDTNFRNATFSIDAYFSEAIFTGIALCIGATFSGDANFIRATFSDDADFNEATFWGIVYINQATFSGDAYFNEATFSGETYFSEATFSGVTDFSDAKFSGTADFSDAKFSGTADFSDGMFTGTAEFVGINVESRISFEDVEFHRIPDFSAAKNPERIALDTVEFKLPGPSGGLYGFFYRVTGLYGSDRSTMIRIRHIRGIANKNHAVDTERELTILERNAQVGAAWATLVNPLCNILNKLGAAWTTLVATGRIAKNPDAISTDAGQILIDRNAPIGAIPELWQDSKPLRQWFANLLTTILETVLLLAYRWSSKYGRSVVVPVLWLVGIFYSYRWLYGYLYDKVCSDYLKAKNVSESLLDFTITSMVPFGSNVRPTYQIAVNNLFRPIEQTMLEGRVPAMFQFASLSQGVLTLTFVFLIGLALRNFFRMK